MSRNSAGTYTLPIGANPVVTGTSISSASYNTTNSDIASELSNSLDRQGRGAMLAPLQLQDGAVGAPGLAFGTESTTGLYRAGAGDARLSVQGTDAVRAQSGGLVTIPTLTVSNGLTLGGNVTLSGGNPAYTVGQTNKLTSSNTPKAWGNIGVNAGSFTVNEGFNIQSVGFSGIGMRVTLASAMANANYCPIPQTFAQMARVIAMTSTYFDVRISDYATGADYDLHSGVWSIWFTVLGKQ